MRIKISDKVKRVSKRFYSCIDYKCFYFSSGKDLYREE